METEIHETRLDVKSIRADMAEVKSVVNRQKGFWAGVTFMASVVGFDLSQVWQYLKGGG